MTDPYICNIESQQEIKYLQDALYVISGKWKIEILISIINGNHRYREIAKNIPGVTFKMLTKELKEMEMNKLITRTVHEESPGLVRYTATEYSKTLYPLIEQMIGWAKHHRTVI